METVFFDAQMVSDDGEGRYTLGRMFFPPGFLEERGFDTTEVDLEVLDERSGFVRDTIGQSGRGVREEV